MSQLTWWKTLEDIGRCWKTVEDDSSVHTEGSNTSRSHWDRLEVVGSGL